MPIVQFLTDPVGWFVDQYTWFLHDPPWFVLANLFFWPVLFTWTWGRDRWEKRRRRKKFAAAT